MEIIALEGPVCMDRGPPEKEALKTLGPLVFYESVRLGETGGSMMGSLYYIILRPRGDIYTSHC